jgi:UDP-2,3-diacylglucosamine hydrolase
VASLFVSDLHLTARRPETTDLFIDFLAGPARKASALFILGDLFDYWLGDDALDDPFSKRVCLALADLAAAGTSTFFLAGNRDFLTGKDFAAASGLRFIAEPTVCDVAGQPTLLLHGDTLCTDDTDYQAFRATVRSEAWRQDFLARPLAARKDYVEALRARSETEKQTKPYELMDTNAEAVADAFRRHDVARMIHGHTHRQACHQLVVDGRPCQRWVLGEWGASGNALTCDAGGCRWLRLPQ